VAALDLLCARNYRPIEISNVLYRVVEKPAHEDSGNIKVRIIAPEEAELWTDINVRGWTADHPQFVDSIRQIGTVMSRRKQSLCFLAEVDGQPGAAGVLFLHQGVALLGGAATVPELRRRGLQAALLKERLRYAFDAGCDLAEMVAEAGSNSQRNAERKGFRVAYTRTKWRLLSQPQVPNEG
jgi:GNAT superfamily N-acetyltransferase